MSNLRKLQLATVFAWLLVVGVYGWVYVTSQLALPRLEGYEKWRTAQVWFFVLTRVSPALVGLGLLLWVEHRLAKGPGST